MPKGFVYICPRCGSSDWRFPNPLKPSESMVNAPSFINNLLECGSCGYIGIFFEVERDRAAAVQDEIRASSSQKGKDAVDESETRDA